ncbi:electron transport complex protein RnfG [Natronocella acetinitrilica]|uniref:Electron transport complex protein RnfG n=1 Tax=Natronocella acetinitrilica TaxID=414046 RepID=A0AAE3G2W0_9GAMM|nr:hypothetical protein [Natronocella acetinitrilica]MCP1673691.1 electron transport complex protein RnfG [Natronocella acetinitrilica]
MTRDIFLAGVLLLLFSAGGVAAMVGIYQAAIERSDRNRELALMREIQQLVPDDAYDNEPASDKVDVRSSRLGTIAEMPVYRARKGGEPAAAIISTMTAGEGGSLGLLIGVYPNGTVAGLRLLPGGNAANNAVPSETTVAGWDRELAGRGLDELSPEGAILREEEAEDEEQQAAEDDDGEAQVAEAEADPAPPVPPDVVRAVRSVLLYVEQHGETLFAEQPQDVEQHEVEDDGPAT